ncbi:MAG: DsrE/DsrF/DrsH-like family protein [Polyangiales bacterium]
METRRVSIICSKGSLDMAYPGLVLANAARMAGIEVTMFFTFWGLDIVDKRKADHLHLGLLGNPSVPIPSMVAGLPGVEALASAQMRKQMGKLDIPAVPEFLQILADSGAELYACQLAMQMFSMKKEDLVPQVREVITAMDFWDKSAGAQIVFI